MVFNAFKAPEGSAAGDSKSPVLSYILHDFEHDESLGRGVYIQQLKETPHQGKWTWMEDRAAAPEKQGGVKREETGEMEIMWSWEQRRGVKCEVMRPE